MSGMGSGCSVPRMMRVKQGGGEPYDNAAGAPVSQTGLNSDIDALGSRALPLALVHPVSRIGAAWDAISCIPRTRTHATADAVAVA